jgi:hypothetical protein
MMASAMDPDTARSIVLPIVLEMAADFVSHHAIRLMLRMVLH